MVLAAASFTATEYVLAGVVVALSTYIGKLWVEREKLLNDRRESEGKILEASRTAEVAALREILPIAQSAVEILKDLRPFLDRLGIDVKED